MGGNTWSQGEATADTTANGQTTSLKLVVLSSNYPQRTASTQTFTLIYSTPTKEFDQTNTQSFQPMLQSFKFAYIVRAALRQVGGIYAARTISLYFLLERICRKERRTHMRRHYSPTRFILTPPLSLCNHSAIHPFLAYYPCTSNQPDHVKIHMLFKTYHTSLAKNTETAPPLYLGLDAYRHLDKLSYLEMGDRVEDNLPLTWAAAMSIEHIICASSQMVNMSCLIRLVRASLPFCACRRIMVRHGISRWTGNTPAQLPQTTSAR